jgi:hypothetical protein
MHIWCSNQCSHPLTSFYEKEKIFDFSDPMELLWPFSKYWFIITFNLQEKWHENQKKKFESKNPEQEYDEKNNPIENNRMRSNASQSYRKCLHIWSSFLI